LQGLFYLGTFPILEHHEITKDLNTSWEKLSMLFTGSNAQENNI